MTLKVDMTLKVFKYPVPLEDVRHYIKLDMPAGARVLHADVQGTHLCFWALVDIHPSLDRKERVFLFVGTGHPIEEPDEKLRHISTILMNDGMLVWHIFEVI